MFESVRPERVPDHLRWKFECVEVGKKVYGWVAGPVVGVEGHGTPSFKPCRALLTKGAVACPWCALPYPVRYQGYMPIIDKHGGKKVYAINLDNTARVDAMRHLQPVKLHKGPHKNSSLEVFTEEWTTIQPTGNNVTNRPADIKEWLLTVLWKAEGLAQWFEEHKPEHTKTEIIETVPMPAPEVVDTKTAREKLKDMMEARGFKKSALFFESKAESEAAAAVPPPPPPPPPKPRRKVVE